MIVKDYINELFIAIDNYLDKHGYNSVESITITNLGDRWTFEAKHKAKPTLTELAINQIRDDLKGADLTALEELLEYLPEQVLKDYLPKESDDEPDYNGYSAWEQRDKQDWIQRNLK